MADVTISYKGATIATMDDSGSKTLGTSGKYCEGDIGVEYVKPSGGGEDREDLTVPKDVDFIDFDGRLLYSYTAAEFLELTELPPNPSYPGLVAQGWNWTLADAQEFVAEYGAQVIGQNYITDDGKTRIYISLDNDYVETSMPLRLYVNCASTCTNSVDWGDGSTTTTTGGLFSTHTYAAAGDYIVTIEVTSGTIRLGYAGANNTLFQTDTPLQSTLKKVEIGANVIGLCRNTFYRFPNLQYVSIPTTCIDHDTGSDLGMFAGPKLKAVVFPLGTPGQNTLMVGGRILSWYLNSLKYVSIPKTMTGCAFRTPYPMNLRKLIFPSYTTSVNLDAYLYDAKRLTQFIVPGSYTAIDKDRCRASLIRKLTIPASVTSIAATAFRHNGFLTEVHLLPTTPPTLAATSAFTDGPANRVYYVPYSEDHSILEAYQTATNWSTFAAYMQEEPQ